VSRFARYYFVLVVSVLVMSCSDQPTNPQLEIPQFAVTTPVGQRGSSENPGGKNVTLPFKAKFYTEEFSFVMPSDDCDPGSGLNTQKGEGTATHLGFFTTVMPFCINVTDDFGAYSFVENGRFVTANGDELWFTVTDGQVFPSSELDPPYFAYFRDPFVFTGGTGRFEGATGGGYTDSYVVDGGFHTDHEWTGEVTLRRGR